jgi:hypothetical protein
VRIVRNAPEFFINLGGAYSGKQKIRKQRNNRGQKMYPLLQICNLSALQPMRTDGQPFKSVEQPKNRDMG